MPEPAPESELAGVIRGEAFRAAQRFLDEHPDGTFGDLTAAIAAATMHVVADQHDRAADDYGRPIDLVLTHNYRACARELTPPTPGPQLRIVGGGTGG